MTVSLAVLMVTLMTATIAASVEGQPPVQPIKLVVLGDSLTAGFGL